MTSLKKVIASKGVIQSYEDECQTKSYSELSFTQKMGKVGT